MGIPIGKLQLYTAAAGVPPQALLPMYLDAGTNNEQYLRDPLYLGLRQPRPPSEELYSFVDEFVEAVQEVFPMLHPLRGLDRCRRGPSAATLSRPVLRLQRRRARHGGHHARRHDQRHAPEGHQAAGREVPFPGAGSAGIGLADLFCSALVEQGMSLKDAQAQVHTFDINGLLEPSRTDLVDFQRPYAHPHSPTRDFVAAIKSIRPTTIIGISTVGGAFTQQVVEAMSEINERPVILALSNPTDHAECTPEQAYSWSKGKATTPPGSSSRHHLDGQTFLRGQANNFYIFPAIGMAIYATQAKRVTDDMFIEAARAVADQVPDSLLKRGSSTHCKRTSSKPRSTPPRASPSSCSTAVSHVLTAPPQMAAFIRSHVYKPDYHKLVPWD